MPYSDNRLLVVMTSSEDNMVVVIFSENTANMHQQSQKNNCYDQDDIDTGDNSNSILNLII